MAKGPGRARWSPGPSGRPRGRACWAARPRSRRSPSLRSRHRASCLVPKWGSLCLRARKSTGASRRTGSRPFASVRSPVRVHAGVLATWAIRHVGHRRRSPPNRPHRNRPQDWPRGIHETIAAAGLDRLWRHESRWPRGGASRDARSLGFRRYTCHQLQSRAGIRASRGARTRERRGSWRISSCDHHAQGTDTRAKEWLLDHDDLPQESARSTPRHSHQLLRALAIVRHDSAKNGDSFREGFSRGAAPATGLPEEEV